MEAITCPIVTVATPLLTDIPKNFSTAIKSINKENPIMISGITIGMEIEFSKKFLPIKFPCLVVTIAAISPSKVAPVADINAISMLVTVARISSVSSKTALNHFIENFVQMPAIDDSLNEKNIRKMIGIYRKNIPNIKNERLSLEFCIILDNPRNHLNVFVSRSLWPFCRTLDQMG